MKRILHLHAPHKIGTIFTKRLPKHKLINNQVQYFVAEVQVISCEKVKHKWTLSKGINLWKTEVVVLKYKGMR